MGIIELVLISIGLAMDAFAVSICKGLSIKKVKNQHAIIIGLYFGLFQAIMPLVGFSLGTTFQSFITNIDHWLSFLLLGVIGGKMVKESMKKENNRLNDKIDIRTMMLLSIATSIDALAIGITFAFLKVNLFISIILIGIITFFISFIGVKIGNKVGNKCGNEAEFIGGMVLILIGIKILFEHTGIL